jgi:glycosyltransferase involved in cell wall biosynthesis
VNEARTIFVILPTLKIGGIASVAKALHFEAILQGYDSTLLSFYSSGDPSEYFQKSKCGNFREPSTLFARLLNLLRKANWLRSSVSDNPNALYLCLDPTSVLLVRLAMGSSANCRIIGACFTPYNLLFLSDILIIKLLFPKIRKVIVPSSSSRAEIASVHSEINLAVIPNPLSQESIVCSIRNSRREEIDAVFYGRLSEEKNPFMAIQVAEIAPQFSFEIGGFGHLETSMKSFIHDINMQNLRIVGRKPPSSFLPRSKVLLMTSFYESFGLVVIEAWLHGLKVISSNLSSGPVELIQTFGNGVVVDGKDPKSWMEALDSLLTSKSEEGFERKILDTFSSYTIFSSWIKE